MLSLFFICLSLWAQPPMIQELASPVYETRSPDAERAAKVIPVSSTSDSQLSQCIEDCWNRFDNRGVNPNLLEGYQQCIADCNSQYSK